MLPHSALAVVAMIAAVAHAKPASFAEPKALPVIAGLPDPLLSQDGAPVKTKGDWLVKRAPELRRMFQHYEYGARRQGDVAGNHAFIGAAGGGVASSVTDPAECGEEAGAGVSRT